MKKIRNIILINLISLLLVGFTGCSHFIKPAEKGFVTVSFAINDMTTQVKDSRTSLPVQYSLQDYTEYELKGKVDGAEDYALEKTFTSYGELTSYSETIQEGEWIFNLSAKTEYLGNTETVATAETSITLQSGKAVVVDFSLDHLPMGEGVVYLTGIYPSGESKYLEVIVYDHLGNPVENKTASLTAASTEFTYSISLGRNYYFIEIAFYKDSTKGILLSRKVEAFQILPCHKTYVEVQVTTFTTVYAYRINYYDYKGQDFSANSGDSRLKKILTTNDGLIPLPIMEPVTFAENTKYFEGWYTSEDCTADSEIRVIDTSTLTENLSLYAKWSYKYVYLNPSVSVSKNGEASTSPVKTVEEAKQYLGLYSEAVYVMDTITSSTDIANLSGITTSVYNDAIVKRYKDLITKPVVELNTNETVIISEVTIDGGAVWGNQGAVGSGICELTNYRGSDAADLKMSEQSVVAQAPLVVVSDGTLSVMNNTTLQNNFNNQASNQGNGGGVLVSGGNLNLLPATGSIFVKDNAASGFGGAIAVTDSGSVAIVVEDEYMGCEITGNIAKNGGGISVTGGGKVQASSTLQDEINIKENRAFGYSGGGIYAANGTSVTHPTVSLTRVNIENNAAANATTSEFYGNQGTGGGIYSSNYSEYIIIRSTVSNNIAGNAGSGITSGAYNKSIYIGSCEIKNNQVRGSSSDPVGAGIAIYTGEIAIIDTVVSGNRFTNSSGVTVSGKGSGIYLSANQGLADKTSLVLSGSSTIVYTDEQTGNDIYLANSDKPVTVASLKNIAEQGFVAKLTPAVYPTKELTVKALTLQDASEELSDEQINMFSITPNPDLPDAGYEINKQGFLVSDSETPGGNIELPEYTELRFEFDKNEVNLRSRAETILLSIYTVTEGVRSSVNFSDVKNLTYKVYSGGMELPNYVGITGTLADGIKLSQGLAPGVYEFYITCVYNNLQYGTTLYVEVLD